MVGGSSENQLELFDVSRAASAKPRAGVPGHVHVQLRYDQLVLGGIGVLIGLTIVFAGGVERGKQLARAEHRMLAKELSPVPSSAPEATADETSAEDTKATTESPTIKTGTKRTSTPSVAPNKVKKPTKLVSEPATEVRSSRIEKSRYAIQVVSYSRPQSAKQEMDRLRAGGESAFLVMRDGRTIVFVGPFPSKMHASEKLVVLRTKYQDCFLKTL